MKAIILAGGRGTRISRMIQDVPKCTLPINGEPLIRITCQKMLSRNIQVVVCVGYRQELVKKALEGLPVTFYYNPFYAVTNSIGSLYFALKEIRGDLIIMNGDVYFDDQILDSLISAKEKIVMVVDKTTIETGDYFFATKESGCIVEYGKDLPLERRDSEYVGMAKISESSASEFQKRVSDMVSAQHYDTWWETAIYKMADDGVDIHTLDVNGAFWSEVDFFDEYQNILAHVGNATK
jgi:choline kinase